MITSLYLGLLGFFYIFLTVSVVRARWKHRVSLGVGERGEISSIVGAHENFSNYAPYFLLGLYLLEAQQFNLYVLHLLGVVFVIGRVLHFFGLSANDLSRRKAGMMMTILPLAVLSLLNVYQFVARLLL
jgi:uncharacterized membrane protein YecN with MAPEG domain